MYYYQLHQSVVFKLKKKTENIKTKTIEVRTYFFYL